MEPRVTVVERQEAIERELTAEIIVLATEHLLSHTGANLGLEVEDSAKAQITPFPTLVVFGMLDPATTPKGVHTGEDILVQVESLLRLGDTAAGVHECAVQEIRVTVMQLASDPREGSGDEGTKSLFLASSDVTEHTNVLGEDVLPSTDDRDGGLLELLVSTGGVGTHGREVVLFKLAEDVTDLQALLEVVVLIGVDELEVLSTVEDDGMVLVIRFPVSENGVPRKFDTEFGLPPPGLWVVFRVAIDDGREQPGLATRTAGGLFIQIRDLQIRVRAKEELGVLMLFLVEL